MARERGLRAESKNCEILLFPTADRCFGTKVKCPTGGLILVQIPHCTELNVSQMPGDFPEGMGGFGIDWYIIYQKRETVLQRSIFDEIGGAWIADETLSRVLDISSQSQTKSKLSSKRRSKIVKIYAN